MDPAVGPFICWAATQFEVCGQDTAANDARTELDPSGLATVVHVVPFHVSASVERPAKPTAMQK